MSRQRQQILWQTAVSTNQISLTWKLPNFGGSSGTSFEIERTTASNGVYQVVAMVANTLSYVDTNLAAGTTYYYEVVAMNVVGTSGNSNPAWATTLTNGASLPSGNLVLWLKADAGLTRDRTSTPVSFWADQSGEWEQRDATDGKPAAIVGGRSVEWSPGGAI